MARPGSPTIDSRPMVGVENRARTTDGMAASMKRATPSSVSTAVTKGSDTPSSRIHVPATSETAPMPVHTRGAPVCTSTAKPATPRVRSPTPSGRVGSTASP